MSNKKEEGRQRRKGSIRKKISGTAARPRLSVFRSAKHIYAQVIDDDAHTTLATASTMDDGMRDALKGLKKSEHAKKVGLVIAERCKSKGISAVVFDRNGYIYHGRVMALATAAREGGLQF